MTSKYVTASRARHVTFPRVFPIGAFDTLSSLYTLDNSGWYIGTRCPQYHVKFRKRTNFFNYKNVKGAVAYRNHFFFKPA